MDFSSNGAISVISIYTMPLYMRSQLTCLLGFIAFVECLSIYGIMCYHNQNAIRSLKENARANMFIFVFFICFIRAKRNKYSYRRCFFCVRKVRLKSSRWKQKLYLSDQNIWKTNSNGVCDREKVCQWDSLIKCFLAIDNNCAQQYCFLQHVRLPDFEDAEKKLIFFHQLTQ